MSEPSVNTAPKKHILFVSYYFPPMGGGGVQRIVKFLKYWDYQQYRVTVLTVKPSFFYAEDAELLKEIPPSVRVLHSGSLDPFRLFYLLRKLFPHRKERLKQPRESGAGWRRLANFLFLPDSRLLWLPFALARIERLHREDPLDLMVATVSPFTAGLIGAYSQRLLGIPYVLDLRDAWTENPFHPRISKIHNYFQNRLEALAFRRASGVVFVNPWLEKKYRRKYPFLQEKRTITIRNGYDEEDFRELEQGSGIPESPQTAELAIGIFGTIYSQSNWPLPLMEAVRQLDSSLKERSQSLKIYFVGKWSGDFLNRLRELNLDHRIEQVGYLPHREMLSRARQMDVLVISHQSGLPGSPFITPGRIYEFLRLRKPILALCDRQSDIADLVRGSRAGEVVDYWDVEAIRDLLARWINDKTALRKNYSFSRLEQFNRKELTQTFLKFLAEILTHS